MNHIKPKDWLINRYIKPQFPPSGAPNLFAHYTSKNSAVSIISNEELWLKKTSEMNDISEVKHGVEYVTNHFMSCKRNKLWGIVDNIYTGLSDEIIKSYNAWYDDLYGETYIACFTAFEESSAYGRLSMWRGYGRETPVALILNNSFLDADNNLYGIIITPVFYYTDDQVLSFFSEFNGIAQGLLNNGGANISREVVKSIFLQIFKTISFAFKHPGFSEEKEWRIVYRPSEASQGRLRKVISSDGTINNSFYRLPLSPNNSASIHGVSIRNNLDHVLIGPTSNLENTKSEIKHVLTKTGFQNLESIIRSSNIPYRETS